MYRPVTGNTGNTVVTRDATRGEPRSTARLSGGEPVLTVRRHVDFLRVTAAACPMTH